MTARLVRETKKAGVPQDQCEDLAQEAWMLALLRSGRLRGEHTLGHFCAWLSVVAHNLAIDALRHRDALPIDSLQALRVEVIDEREAELVQYTRSCERLTAWLARLHEEEPDNYRLVCERYLEGRKIHDLAEATGRTAHEISCRIYRAMEKLRLWASEPGLDDETDS